MSVNTTHRQVLILASAQALFQTASVVIVTVGALAGSQIAAAAQLATAPVASMMLGTAIATVPASLWMARAGRKPGFLVGALLGVLGGLLAAVGIWQRSLLLLSLGTLLVGAYQGFAQFYRFAAAEVAEPAFRPRAIGWVLAGGVVAAVLGPMIGRFGGPLLEPEYTGSFLLLAAVSVIAVILLSALRIPPSVAGTEGATARPLGEIVRQPTYLVALFGAATGFGAMVLAMTATPLAMVHHQHSLGAAATVIQLHVLGMFLPSFFTGPLIARFGVVPMMLAGVALLTGHVLMTLSGTTFGSFASALVLLGIGWNFLYIGGTTLLTTTYTAAERGRAQAANDLSIFLVGLAASLSAGALLEFASWQTLNVLLLPWLGLAAAALLWLRYQRRQND